MSSTTGHLFRVTTFGESHGPAIGCVVDGCPPGLEIDLNALQLELDRRRPGQSNLVSPRNELDRFEILSGMLDGQTLGTPIALIVRNRDQRSSDYEKLANQYRPSHADFTTQAKYGIRDARGGGRASARETVGRVAAGAIARQVLAQLAGVEIIAWVDRIGQTEANCVPEQVTREAVESHAVRCPDTAAASRMAHLIEEARDQGDTLGGIVRAVARGVPPGWGEPVFDKLEADLAKALMSLPAAKGFGSGSGFGAVSMRGSEHNDPFEVVSSGAIRTRTNHSGGIQGGISNGMPIEVSVAFKPVSTLGRNQASVDIDGNPVEVLAGGRHDACVLPRAVPMVEACVALVLCDHLLRQRALRGTLD